MLTLPLLSLAICGYAQAQADCIEGNPVMKINGDVHVRGSQK